VTTTREYRRLPNRAAYVAAATQLVANGYELEASCYEEGIAIRPQIVANRNGDLVILRWYAFVDADTNVDSYGSRARRDANMLASTLILEAANNATPPAPEGTPNRAEIARLATLLADTEAWLAACPLRKADAFYETAEYPVDAIVEELVAACGDDAALVESIRAYHDEGEDNTPEGAGGFWRVVARSVS
jgi:hypothetical protein